MIKRGLFPEQAGTGLPAVGCRVKKLDLREECNSQDSSQTGDVRVSFAGVALLLRLYLENWLSAGTRATLI